MRLKVYFLLEWIPIDKHLFLHSQQAGLYYLGEQVNVFRRGTIVNSQQRDQNKELPFANPIIYGKVNSTVTHFNF
jgi:hypothetical protein